MDNMTTLDDAYINCADSFDSATVSINSQKEATDALEKSIAGLADIYDIMASCGAVSFTKICELKQQIEDSDNHSDGISDVIEQDRSDPQDTSFIPGEGLPTYEDKLVQKAFKAKDTENKKLSYLRNKISIKKIQKMSFEKRQQYLENNMPVDETISAWCADLTENLTGEIGTIEVPGESQYIQIQPGFESNATYDQARDGQLLPTVVATPAQAFYNLAMMPGWQKWKPLFRYATITSIDGDTASIDFENISSSQQNLNINQTTNAKDVKIEYMNCNGSAFEVSDSVLVKFTDQNFESPVIVGFKDNPKTCSIAYLLVQLDDEYVIWDVQGEDFLSLPEEFSYPLDESEKDACIEALSLEYVSALSAGKEEEAEYPMKRANLVEHDCAYYCLDGSYGSTCIGSAGSEEHHEISCCQYYGSNEWGSSTVAKSLHDINPEPNL